MVNQRPRNSRFRTSPSSMAARRKTRDRGGRLHHADTLARRPRVAPELPNAFLHDWKDLDKKDRCLACGGKGHMARECPSKLKGPRGSPTSTTPTSRPTSPTSPSTATRMVRIDESKNEVQEAIVQPEVLASPAAPATELKDMLTEASKVLKALSATHLKSLHLGQLGREVELSKGTENFFSEPVPSGLLDSGASNPLRRAIKRGDGLFNTGGCDVGGRGHKDLEPDPFGHDRCPRIKQRQHPAYRSPRCPHPRFGVQTILV